jgi:hypothetical protein
MHSSTAAIAGGSGADPLWCSGAVAPVLCESCATPARTAQPVGRSPSRLTAGRLVADPPLPAFRPPQPPNDIIIMLFPAALVCSLLAAGAAPRPLGTTGLPDELPPWGAALLSKVGKLEGTISSLQTTIHDHSARIRELEACSFARTLLAGMCGGSCCPPSRVLRCSWLAWCSVRRKWGRAAGSGGGGSLAE